MQTITKVHKWTLALAAGVALAVAGCGGSDDSSSDEAEFKSAAKAASAETSKIGDDLGSAIQAADKQTDAELATQFTDLASRARAVVADLNGLKPPDEARAKVNALVSALGTGAQDLDAIATAARANDADSARSATVTLVKDSPAIKSAREALDAELAKEK